MQLRTLGTIELREDGFLYETLANLGDLEEVAPKIGATKIDPLNIEGYYFYKLTLSKNVIFESIIKMIENYPSLQKTNPYFKDILKEYDKVKDKEYTGKRTYTTLLFEQYIIDNVESFQLEPAYYGFNVDNEELRYDILYEDLHVLLKLPVFIGNIIAIYCDEDSQPIDSVMFDYYNLDFITFLKTTLINLQEGGKPEEKAEAKIEFMKEVALQEKQMSKSMSKLKLVKKDKGKGKEKEKEQDGDKK